jgi:hypothetical protein
VAFASAIVEWPAARRLDRRNRRRRQRDGSDQCGEREPDGVGAWKDETAHGVSPVGTIAHQRLCRWADDAVGGLLGAAATKGCPLVIVHFVSVHFVTV